MSSPTITLVAVTTRNVPGHIRAINRTMMALQRPCERLIICPQKPALPTGFRWLTTTEFEHWKYPDSYNNVLIRRMADLIDTDFIITVHDDGFGRNADRWTDDFFRYDYVGAPWPLEWACGGYHVGNGGFSLRSRQLLWLSRESPPQAGSEAEDVHICRTHRAWFEQRKCRFAPIELALRFSIEYVISLHPAWTGRHSFGFHGKHHLVSGNQAGAVGLQISDFTPVNKP